MLTFRKMCVGGSPDGSEHKESACCAGDMGDMDSISGLGRSPEKEVTTHSSILG